MTFSTSSSVSNNRARPMPPTQPSPTPSVKPCSINSSKQTPPPRPRTTPKPSPAARPAGDEAAAIALPDLATPVSLVVTPAPSGEVRRPIMALLDRTPVGRTLDDWGIDIYGHAEAGWTFNMDNPSNNQNAFRLF